jgi:hypothetical protein
MKRLTILLATLALLVTAAAAQAEVFDAAFEADIDSIYWEPNSDDVNVASITAELGDWLGFPETALYIYDWGSEATFANARLLVDADNPFASAQFNEFGTRTVTVHYGDGSQSDPLQLGPDYLFGLFFADGDAILDSYFIETGLGLESYMVWVDETTNNFDANGAFTKHLVNIHDAAPIPLPAAAWLLVSGLLGLLGFRKKVRG